MQNNPLKPIIINNLTISCANKLCVTKNFNYNIEAASRIAIIGNNGTGKTSFLNMLANYQDYKEYFYITANPVIAYIPQTISNEEHLSGGELFMQKLEAELIKKPTILLLDEPTNHLDTKNRAKLFHILQNYTGTLIVTSHDTYLLNTVTNVIFHIHDQQITVFKGKYNNYLAANKIKLEQIKGEIQHYKHEKVLSHKKLMKQQQNTKNKSAYGEKKYSSQPPILAGIAKSTAKKTAAKKLVQISSQKNEANANLKGLYLPETITPKFYIKANTTAGNKIILNIKNATCQYNNKIILNNINLCVSSNEKIIIKGNNGAGKSSLFKAILNDSSITIKGEWYIPKPENIGYLSQHYEAASNTFTPIELIANILPNFTNAEIRNYLNSFLLSKNEQVLIPSKLLSGGEKVRLNLAMLAAKTPQLLLLDEITNNVDLETKAHLVKVLLAYPAAFILVCHDEDFINQLNITSTYEINQGILYRV